MRLLEPPKEMRRCQEKKGLENPRSLDKIREHAELPPVIPFIRNHLHSLKCYRDADQRKGKEPGG
jgi:hypothetical protein